MHREALWGALALAACASEAEPLQCPELPALPSDWAEAPDHLDRDAFDAEVREALREACIPALSVAVVRQDGVVLNAAWGVRRVDTAAPVTVDTPFMVASTSKAIVGLALLAAEAEGHVRMDDRVSDLVGFPVENHRLGGGPDIQLVHLATHTSGIQDNWEQVLDAGYQPGDPTEPLDAFMREYLTEPGDHFYPRNNFYGWPAGREWLYSNVGAALSALAVQEASGEPFDAFTRSRFFEPLGMQHSGWFLADFDPDEVASPHQHDPEGLTVLEHYGFPTWPDGQLRASARDLGQILRVALGRGAVDGVRLLPEDRMEALEHPPIEGLDDWYVRGFIEQQNLLWFGMTLGDRWIVGHDGDDDGVSSEMFYDPKTGVGVALVTSVPDGGPGHPVRDTTAWLQERLFTLGEVAP